MEKQPRVCLGIIAGPHGVRGQVRVRSYTVVPDDIAAYGVLTNREATRSFELSLVGTGPKGQLLGRIAGIDDRDAAAALKGTELYVERDRLPDSSDDGSFYHADLIGLAARLADGTPFGRVTAVHDFGAGDVLEIVPPDGEPVMLPFTHAVVPEVDVAAGHIVVDPPAGLLTGDARSDDRDRPDGESGSG